ncbi:MAG: OmpA family protein [Candidatus Omnitrophota bacterium]
MRGLGKFLSFLMGGCLFCFFCITPAIAVEKAGRQYPPFQISVDGQPIGPGASHLDTVEKQDRALEEGDVHIIRDNLKPSRRLSVAAWPNGAHRNEPVTFRGFSNYSTWITKAEVRIFDGHSTSVQREPLAVIPFASGQDAVWTPDEKSPGKVVYVLRVYDEKNRFDETGPQTLEILNTDQKSGDEDSPEREKMISYGENHLRLMNIPVQGGKVVVYGKNVGEGAKVRWSGQKSGRPILAEDIPVDKEGKFMMEQILPSGKNDLAISVENVAGERSEYERSIEIPRNDWFLVGIADVMGGRHFSNNNSNILTLTGDKQHYGNDFYWDSRLAFYFKGTLAEKYRLTASMDTEMAALEDMLSGFGERQNEQFLRIFDSDRYYPVYGDDSTISEDAPTGGKFYAKLESGKSHIMWGNFETALADSDFLQFDRALYGGQLHYATDATTAYGENKIQVDLFAADPDTLEAREEFLGTGGSLYYLRHQNITAGSERLRIEVRDKDSGMVIASQDLVQYQDYDFNPIQGRLILTRPLASTDQGKLLVKTGSFSGNPQYLVVRYEYATSFVDPASMAVGGRATAWLGDHVRIGGMASREQQSEGEANLVGGDVILRATPGNYVKSEVAYSMGPGAGALDSSDGGFCFGQIPQKRIAGVEAMAWRIESGYDANEWTWRLPLKGSFYLQDREAGFSAPGQITAEDTLQYGGEINVTLHEKVTLLGKADRTRTSLTPSKSAVEADLNFQWTPHWSNQLGVRSDWIEDSPNQLYPYASQQDGTLTDLIVRLAYDSLKLWRAYAFIQPTLQHQSGREENNRFGVGGDIRVTDRASVGAEVSEGNGGLGVALTTDYRMNDRSNVYLTYNVDATGSHAGLSDRQSSFTFGERTRFSDALSVFGERRLTQNPREFAATRNWGMNYAPTDRWTYILGYETGQLQDIDKRNFDRNAVSAKVSYAHEKIKAASGFEWRKDESTDGSENRRVLLSRNNLAYQVTEDWRAQSKLDFSFSDSSQGRFFQGDFMEFMLGGAYRPVRFDRFNGLAKYTYFQNLPSPGQVTASGTLGDYEQRSHIASIDGIYDLTKRISLGAKYGLRVGEVRAGRTGGAWFSSAAQLGILRGDLHLPFNLDLLVEGRVLHVHLAKDTRAGILAAMYRKIYKNMKVGMGWNFTDFSDDLTDFDYDDHGFFVNLVGEF